MKSRIALAGAIAAMFLALAAEPAEAGFIVQFEDGNATGIHQLHFERSRLVPPHSDTSNTPVLTDC